MKKLAKRWRIGEMVALVLWPFIASWITFAFECNFLVSTLWFFGLPSLYFSLKHPRLIRKLMLFSSVFGVFIGIAVDLVMERTGGWYAPQSVFDPFRLFGLVTIDYLIWTVLYLYLVVLVYESFLDTEPTHRVRMRRFPYFFRIALGAFIVASLLHAFAPAALFIPYFYFILGVVFCIIPVSFVLWKHPRLLSKFALTTAYFAFFTLANELTGVSLGHWTFPGIGQHIGFVVMLGVRFPLEEFVFWILFGGMATLAWYEYFADDNR